MSIDVATLEAAITDIALTASNTLQLPRHRIRCRCRLFERPEDDADTTCQACGHSALHHRRADVEALTLEWCAARP